MCSLHLIYVKRKEHDCRMNWSMGGIPLLYSTSIELTNYFD